MDSRGILLGLARVGQLQTLGYTLDTSLCHNVLPHGPEKEQNALHFQPLYGKAQKGLLTSAVWFIQLEQAVYRRVQ